MLRQVARRLLAQASSTSRALTTSAARMEETAAPAGPKEFAELWNKKAPNNMDVPQLPSSFLKATSTGDSKTSGDLFPVNFYMPHGVLCDMAQVGSVQSLIAKLDVAPHRRRLCTRCHPRVHAFVASNDMLSAAAIAACRASHPCHRPVAPACPSRRKTL